MYSIYSFIGIVTRCFILTLVPTILTVTGERTLVTLRDVTSASKSGDFITGLKRSQNDEALHITVTFIHQNERNTLTLKRADSQRSPAQAGTLFHDDDYSTLLSVTRTGDKPIVDGYYTHQGALYRLQPITAQDQLTRELNDLTDIEETAARVLKTGAEHEINEITDFSLPLTERGTRFTERARLHKNNVLELDVPSHNSLNRNRFFIDHDKNTFVHLDEERGRCIVTSPVYRNLPNMQEMKRNLEVNTIFNGDEPVSPSDDVRHLIVDVTADITDREDLAPAVREACSGYPTYRAIEYDETRHKRDLAELDNILTGSKRGAVTCGATQMQYKCGPVCPPTAGPYIVSCNIMEARNGTACYKHMSNVHTHCKACCNTDETDWNDAALRRCATITESDLRPFGCGSG